jgi:hypothetical protein
MEAYTSPNAFSSSQQAPASSVPAPFMLRPHAAWKTLCARTGGAVHLGTFYRWLRNGKVYSVRLGYNIFIPRPSLEELIQECLAGERT